MTPHLEQRFRKAYPGVCQIVLRRLVEWKWGRVILFIQFCAGLSYIRVPARLSGFGLHSRNLYAFGPICRVSEVLLMMTGPDDDDGKRSFFYYSPFWIPSLPWLVVGLGFSASRKLRVGGLFYG